MKDWLLNVQNVHHQIVLKQAKDLSPQADAHLSQRVRSQGERAGGQRDSALPAEPAAQDLDAARLVRRRRQVRPGDRRRLSAGGLPDADGVPGGGDVPVDVLPGDAALARLAGQPACRRALPLHQQEHHRDVRPAGPGDPAHRPLGGLDGLVHDFPAVALARRGAVCYRIVNVARHSSVCRLPWARRPHGVCLLAFMGDCMPWPST